MEFDRDFRIDLMLPHFFIKYMLPIFIIYYNFIFQFFQKKNFDLVDIYRNISFFMIEFNFLMKEFLCFIYFIPLNFITYLFIKILL